jgi:hypothetical protein
VQEEGLLCCEHGGDTLLRNASNYLPVEKALTSQRIQMIQINQPTRCNSFTSLLLDVYVWLNMFRAPLRPSSGVYNCTMSLWFYLSSVEVGALLVVVWQTTTDNAPTVKPEAPSAVVRS